MYAHVEYYNHDVHVYHNGYRTRNIFKLNAQTYQAQMKYCWASSRDFSTHHIGDQRML